jgi:sugar/nucleoside kinase (ribokinase family)
MVLRTPGADPILSFVFTHRETGERTILHSDLNIHFPSPREFPDPDWPSKAKAFLFDHVAGRAGIETARRAKDAGLPVVVDIERNLPHASDALEAAAHVVVGEAFASDFTGERSIGSMLRALRSRDDQAVVITRGAQGCVGLAPQGEFSLPAFPVDVVDTTGCGDVFHGAYALALTRGQDPQQAARFASGAAALTATRQGGRDGIPTAAELDAFLAQHSS